MTSFIFGDDWKLNLSRGKVRNAYAVHKFGSNPTPANGIEHTVWDGASLYPWASWDAGASLVYLKSSDAGDTSITVYIEGLDENYNVQSEIVTLDPTNPLTTAAVSVNTYIRLFRMYNSSATSELGDITAHYGSDAGVVVAQITAGEGQSLMAVYTVPLGHTALILNHEFSGSGASALKSRFMRRNAGEVFRNQHAGSVSGNQYNKTYAIPLVCGAKSDIDIRVIPSTGSSQITSSFEMVLIKDNEFTEWSSGY